MTQSSSAPPDRLRSDPAGDSPVPTPAVWPAAEPAGAADDRLTVLLALHGAEVYRYLRRLSPTAEDAADLHQEAFLRAHRALDHAAPVVNERAWLYRIAGNLARDAHRRRVVRAHLTAIDDDPGGPLAAVAAVSGDPHASLVSATLREAIQDALIRLSWRQRTAIVARVLDGRDYGEVAAALDCTEVTARQHVSQGLRKLRTWLSPEWEELR